MEDYVRKLVVISVILIAGVLMIGWQANVFSDVSTEISNKSVDMSVYNVQLLQPSGTPLTFYHLPNGDYYTILKVKAQTNITSLPVSFPVPVKVVPLKTEFDNTTREFVKTFAVIVTPEAMLEMEKSPVIYLQAINSKLFYYPVTVVDEPGPYADDISDDGNEDNAPSDDDVIKSISVTFDSAVVTTSPVVDGRDFDGILYIGNNAVQSPTAGTLSGYALGTLSNDWEMVFHFGRGPTRLTATIPVSDNLVIFAMNSTNGDVAIVGNIKVSYSNGTYSVSVGSNTYTASGKFVAVAIDKDGNTYLISETGASKIATTTAPSGSITITINKPFVIVGFTKDDPSKFDEGSFDTIGKIFKNTLLYLTKYAQESESQFKDKVKAEYYSIFNTFGLKVSGDYVFVPTTVASGRYTPNVGFKVYASPSISFLISDASDYRGTVPVDYIEDYVFSPDGFEGISSVQTNTNALTPSIVPAGSLRFLWFGNLTFIAQNLSWVFSQTKISDYTDGYQSAVIYQGGKTNRYIVFTQWNTTDVQPVPISWKWVNRKGDASGFCCFYTADYKAYGIDVTISSDPATTVIRSGDNKYEMEIHNIPYSVGLMVVTYTNGYTCELSLYGAPSGYKCPMYYMRKYKVYNLYQEMKPVNNIRYNSYFRMYMDHPCFDFDDIVDYVLIMPGLKKGDIPDEYVFVDNPSALSVSITNLFLTVDVDGKDFGFGVKYPFLFHDFLNGVWKRAYAYPNYKIASLNKASG